MTGPSRLLAASAVLLLLLAGCGKSSSSSSTTSTTSTTAPTTSTSAATTSALTVKVATTAKLGKVLVDATGLTLYRFDNDTGTTSNCSGGCATTWPPALLPAGVKTPVGPAGVTGLGTTTRADGSVQVTYQGHPQYRYARDTNPGDTNGDGVGGVWHASVVTG